MLEYILFWVWHSTYWECTCNMLKGLAIGTRNVRFFIGLDKMCRIPLTSWEITAAVLIGHAKAECVHEHKQTHQKYLVKILHFPIKKAFESNKHSPKKLTAFRALIVLYRNDQFALFVSHHDYKIHTCPVLHVQWLSLFTSDIEQPPRWEQPDSLCENTIYPWQRIPK